MKRRNYSKSLASICMALATLCTASVATVSAEKPAAARAEVAVSGVFSGTLSDLVTIGSQEVLITSKTSLFRVGKGAFGRRHYVVDESVWVTGRMEGGVLVARMAIVKPRPGNNELRQLTDAHRKPKPRERAQ